MIKFIISYFILSFIIDLKSNAYEGLDMQNPGSTEEKGIFCLYWGTAMDQNYRARIDSVLSLEYIRGLSLYIPWRDFEPQNSNFKWDYLDIPLEEVLKHGKSVCFGLTVAAQSPEWLKDTARTFTFVHTHPAVGEQTAPVPWDSVYFTFLSRTIRAIGNRYDGNQNIYYITINGPSTLYGVETNWPLKYNLMSEEDIIDMDFSLQKFERAWKDHIDLFFDAFPNTRLALGLHHSLSIPSYTEEEKMQACKSIRDYAIAKYNLEHPGEKMVLRLLGLCHDNPLYFIGEYSGPESVTDYISMVWDRKDDVIFSYETSRVWSRPNPGGPINDAVSFDYFWHMIRNGISFQANSIEIKIPDIWDDLTNSPYEPYIDALIYGTFMLNK